VRRARSTTARRRRARRAHLANIEAVVDLVLEGTHLNHADEALVDLGLAVELGEERGEVVAYEVRLVVGRRVERREGEATNALLRMRGEGEVSDALRLGEEGTSLTRSES
jgi:hypothetical protein